MNGIERAENLYNSAIAPMIEERFGEFAGRIAAGIAGQGSDCRGYDDGVSADHDSGTGLCLWLDDETYGIIGGELAKEYRLLAPEDDSDRKGVMRIGAFYESLTGSPEGPRNWREWMYTPSHYLADATDGRVFRDDSGTFSRIREHILYGMPEDVRLKKIAANLALMAQSGQYNYPRMLAHGEYAAAQLARFRFAEHAIALLYLMNFRHAPFYKWQFRGIRDAGVLGNAVPLIEDLLLRSASETSAITDGIENVCAMVAEELASQGLSDIRSDYLEPHALAVTDRIENTEIRSLHLMECGS